MRRSGFWSGHRRLECDVRTAPRRDPAVDNTGAAHDAPAQGGASTRPRSPRPDARRPFPLGAQRFKPPRPFRSTARIVESGRSRDSQAPTGLGVGFPSRPAHGRVCACVQGGRSRTKPSAPRSGQCTACRLAEPGALQRNPCALQAPACSPPSSVMEHVLRTHDGPRCVAPIVLSHFASRVSLSRPSPRTRRLSYEILGVDRISTAAASRPASSSARLARRPGTPANRRDRR